MLYIYIYGCTLNRASLIRFIIKAARALSLCHQGVNWGWDAKCGTELSQWTGQFRLHQLNPVDKWFIP